MFGNVAALALRTSDGQVTCTGVHKTELAPLLHVPELYASEAEARSVLGAGEPVPLAPLTYGLVVLDFVSQRLIDANGYGVLGGVRAGSLGIALAYDRLGDLESDDVRALEVSCVRRMTETGRLGAAFTEGATEGIPLRGWSWAQLTAAYTYETYRALPPKDATGRAWTWIEFDLSPFTVEWHDPHTASGIDELQQRLRDLDFRLTAEHAAAWQTRRAQIR